MPPKRASRSKGNMVAERKLERARDARLGGVCSGIARYFRVDPVIVRIVFVGGTLLTGGLLAIAYIALVFVLPKSNAGSDVFDVEPESASSDRFGPMKCASPRADGKTGRDACAGVGHLPPEPPAAFRK